MEQKVILVICAVLASTLAVPIQLSSSQDRCSTTCTGSSKFQFKAGRTYQYKYESDMKTLVKGASEDHAALHVTADIDLEILSKCELNMKLRNVRLDEYDPVESIMRDTETDFANYLQRYPVRLSYQDGTIADVCLTADEPAWVLNVKRGIISLLQNNIEDLNSKSNNTISETDVNGVCDTEYYVKNDGWYTKTIGKSKNLLGCTERGGHKFTVQSVPYLAESSIQSLPVLKSDHSCEHTIDKDSGLLQSASCTEQHTFRPFSNSDNGATTINKQTLHYISITSGTRPPRPITSRVSLKFDHADITSSDSQNRNDIINKLQQICEVTVAGVTSDTPKLFADLVYLMKAADTTTLKTVYQTVNGDTFCPDNSYRTKQFFLDALPMTGTTGAVVTMAELIQGDMVEDDEAEMWLTTVPFVKTPTSDMLVALKPLMDIPKRQQKAMLTLGSLVHSYCRSHDNCEREAPVQDIVQEFRSKIVQGCKVNIATMKSTLLALRGIGNAGYATSAIPELESCILAATNPMEARISAIQAFRRMPCGSSRSALVRVLEDVEEDSELRIWAYKILMECPSPSLLNTVKAVLDSEQVNQVGSYIWTHLTNLMETSDRHKQDIRSLLDNVKLQKEFDLDKRKFSRNYEGSMFLDAFNTGAKAEGDLIWSQKSFLPRAAAVNLTVDLFGHSINLFEMGGRVEGMDYFLEQFFGPDGIFSKYAPTEDEPTTDLDVPNVKMDKLSKINKRMSATKSELSGSLYMRVFGNELHYKNFNSLDDLMMASQFNALEMLINLAEKNEYTYTHSSLFLDGSYIVPMSSGFPLNLTVNGTATVDLRMKGKMDLRSIPMVNIDGLIQPSAAIDISSVMSVDAYVTKSGIKMQSTLHTSTSVQGRVSVDKAGSVLAELDTPQDKRNIIDFKTSFFTLHRDTERPQKMIDQNRQTKILCSSTGLVTMLGVQVCSELSYPNASWKIDSPFFPLTGPVNGGIYLYKRDHHTKYHFSLKSIHNAYKNRMLFMFDTPESLVYRQLKVDINLSKKDLDLVVDVATPWQNAYVQGKLTNTKKLKSFYGDINIQGVRPYVINAQVPVVVVGNKYEYKPSLEILSNKKQLYTIDGLVSHKGIRQFQMEVGAKGFTKTPMSAEVTINNNPKLIGLKGSVELEKGKTYSIDSNVKVKGYTKKATYTPFLSVRTPTEEKLSFGGSVAITYGNKVAVKLVLDKVVDKRVLLNGFIQRLERNRGRVLYKTKVKFESSPADLALNLKVDNHNSRIISTDMQLGYVIRKVARNSIKFVSKFIDQSSRARTQGRTSMNLEVKRNPELNMKMMASVERNAKRTQMDVDVIYGADFKDTSKKLDFSLISNHVLPNMEITSRLRFPALGIATRVNGNHHMDNNNMTSRWSVEYSKGKSISTTLELLNESTDKMKISTNFDLSYPGRTISLSHNFAEIAHEKYISTFTAGLQKGQMNKIETSFERASDKKMIVATEISLSEQEPFRVQGQYGYTDRDFIARLDYTTDIKSRKPQQYAVYMEGKIDDIAFVTIGAEKPDFGVDLTMKAQLQGVFAIESDLELRNDSHSDNYAVKLWFDPTVNNLNGSLTLIYPSRTIIVSANHQIGSKQKTGVNVQWGPGEFIDVDTSFELDVEDLFGTAAVRSSLLSKPVKITVNHGSDKSKYTTKLDMDWGETLTINSVVNKPISIQTLVATIVASSSLKDIRKMNLFINHKMKNSVVSSAKFGWNKQFYEIDVTAEDTSKDQVFGFTGQVDLKTSNSYMKKGTFSISHDNNGNTFNTNIKAIRNKRKYLIDSKITHLSKTYRYTNKGEITVTMPSTSMNTKWDHEHASDRFSSKIEGQWDKEYSMAQVSGDFRYGIDTACQIRFPVRRGEAVFEQKLLVKAPHIDGQLNLKMNGKNLANFEVYIDDKENFTTGYLLEIPDMDVNSKVQFTTYDGRGQYIANLMGVFTPDATFNLDLKQKFFADEHISLSTIDWKSTFPGHEKFKYTYEVLDSTNNELKTITTVEYKEGKKIQLQTVLLIDLHKQYEYRALLTTPFESLPSIQGGINFAGDREKFTSTVYLEIVKYLEKISAEVKWDTVDQLYCGVELLLVNDMQITGEVKLANERAGSANIAFRNQHSQLYSVSTEYSIYDKSEGMVTITIPGQRDITLKLTHDIEKTGFITQFEVQHNRNNNLLLVVKYSAAETLYFSSTFNLRTTVLPELDNTKFSAMFDGSKPMVNIDGQITTPISGRYGVYFNLDLSNNVQATFTTMTPTTYNIMAKFSYTVEPYLFQSRTELQMDGSSLLDVFIKRTWITPSFTGKIHLKSAVTEDFELNTFVSGDINSVSTVVYGQSKAELTIKSTRSTSLIKRTLQFSATGLPNVDIEVEHDDIYNNIGSVLQVNNGTYLHKVDASFNMDDIRNSLTTKLNIQTPLMQTVDFTFNIYGLATNFKVHTDITLGTERSEASFDFIISPDILIQSTIKSHYIPVTFVSLRHTGSFPNTETNFILTLPRQNNYALTMKMGSTKRQLFSLLIETPINGLTSIGTDLHFAQQADRVTSSVNCKVITNGNKNSNLDWSFQFQGNSLSTQFYMSCPGIPAVNATLTHEGSTDNFKCHAEYSLGSDQTTADFSFSTAANLRSSLKVDSPYFDPVVFTLKHTGTHARQFSTMVDTLVQGYSGQMNVDVDLVNKAKVNAEFDLPELYILASVNETTAGYKGELKYMSNDDIYSLQADYALTNKMTVKGKLDTPVMGLTTDFDGTFTEFEASAVLYNEDGATRNTFRLDADDLSDINMKYLLTKANGEIIDVDVSEAYSKRLVKFNGSFKRDGSRLYGVDVSLLNKASPSANVEIVAPMKYSPARVTAIWNPKETGFTFIGNLDLNRDKSTVELNFDNSQKTESTITIRSSFIPPVNGKFILTENYNLESDLYIDGKQQGSLKMVVGDNDWQFSTLPNKMTVSLVQGEDRKMDLDYDLDQRIVNFDLSSTTPHALRVIYNLQASLPEFNWNSELIHQSDKWQLATSLSTNNNIQGNFKMEKPDQDPIVASLTHIKKYNRCSTQAVFSWNDTTKLEADLSLNWRNGIDSTFSVTTPFKGYEVSEIKVSHERSIPFIKSSAGIRFAGEKGSVSVDLSKENGEITLKTPFEYVEDIVMTYYVKGDVNDLKTGGTVRYAIGKEAKLDISHSFVGMRCASSASLLSPFADITVSTEHVGTWTDFTNTLEFSLDVDNKITSKTSFKLGMNSLAFLNTLTTVATGETFEQVIELKHNGPLSQFQSGLLLESLGQKIALDASFQMQPVLEGKLSLVTPMENMKDMGVSFSHREDSSQLFSTAEVKYDTGKVINGKIDVNSNGWKRLNVDIELKTPFENFETTSIVYNHNGGSGRMQCEAVVSAMRKTMQGTMSASITPLSFNLNIDTPFEQYEKLGLKGNLVADREGHYTALIQTGWNPRNQITMDTSLTLSPLDVSIVMTTPFQRLRQGSVEVYHKNKFAMYTAGVKVVRNSDPLFDMTADYDVNGARKNLVLTFQAPRKMLYSINGDLTTRFMDIDMNLNWNQDSLDDNLKIEGGFDIRTVDKTVKASVSNRNLFWSVDMLCDDVLKKVELAWGRAANEKVGCKYQYTARNMKGKLILPARSLQLSLTRLRGQTKGEFLWDADNDITKKISFQSVVVTDNDAVTADITITMPKDVQLGSKLTVNSGRVLFEGRTQLSYSTDISKNIVFFTKLEDLTQAETANYSLSVGVSQPYTTIDVLMNSHVSSSKSGYSANIGLDYLTATRLIKTFKIAANIDKIKKTVNFELQSPMKTIDIYGNLQMDRKLIVILRNMYDARRPLNTVLYVDPASRMIDFYINYDVDSPSKKVQFTARYVNSTSVRAEVSHSINGAKTTDAIFTTRLNNSHLLHSRLHWRPQAIPELKAYWSEVIESYSDRASLARMEMKRAVIQELLRKLSYVIGEMSEEVGKEYMERVARETLKPALSEILKNSRMYLFRPTLRTNSMSTRIMAIRHEQPVDVVIQNNTNYMEGLRKRVMDKFSFVSEKLSLPRQHVPRAVTNMMGHSMKFVGQALPSSTYKQMEYMTRDWQVEEHIENFLAYLLQREEEKFQEALHTFEDITLSYMKSPITIWDPANGEIQMEQYLLFPVYSLDVMPVVDFVGYLEKVKDMMPKSLPSVDLPSLDMELMPPFTGVAAVSNGKKITTFDGYVYDLDSDCTYVLTRDFMDENFTVILTNDEERTLTVIVGKTVISINLQEQLLVNNDPVSLPFGTGNMVVYKDLEDVVVISSRDHFTINYNTNIDHITIKINGWYFGKTGGLLGTHDNEPSNDLMTSFNKPNDNVSRFAKTWEVGSAKCR